MRKHEEYSLGRPASAIKLLALAAASLCIYAGCTAPTAPPDEVGVVDVAMRNIAFDPQEVTIEVGQSVRWTNLETFIAHTTTSGNPGDADLGSLWDSGNLQPGESFAFEFNEVGEFIYFCEIHPVQMRDAKVIVTAPE